MNRTAILATIVMCISACAYVPPKIIEFDGLSPKPGEAKAYIGTLDTGVSVNAIDGVPVSMRSFPIVPVRPGPHRLTVHVSGAGGDGDGLYHLYGTYSVYIEARSGKIYEPFAMLDTAARTVRIALNVQDESQGFECTSTHRTSYMFEPKELKVCESRKDTVRGVSQGRVQYMNIEFPTKIEKW